MLKSRDETDLVRVAALTEAWKARGASFLQGVAEADSANIEADDSSLAVILFISFMLLSFYLFC